MIRVALLLSFVFSQACVAEDFAKSKYPRVVIGKVTDVDGKPIEGARIEYGYFSAKAADREFTLSGADGKYRLEAKKAGRDYRLGVSAKGYAPQFVGHFIPGPKENPTEHSVKLTVGARVNLRVTSRNGNPLKNLELCPTTPTSGFYSSFSSPTPQTPLPGADRAVVTDADGRLTLDSLPSMPGSPYAEGFQGKRNPTPWLGLEIRAKGANGYQMHTLTIEDVAKAKPGEPVAIQVSNSLEEESLDGVLKGRVVDKESGQAIADFVVVRRYSPLAEKFSDESGRFTVGGKIRRGRVCQTRVFAPGYSVCVAKPVANIASAAREQKFELVKHPSFFGRLVDKKGNPISHAEILSGVTPKKGYTYVDWSTLDSYADGHHSLENVVRVTTDEDGEFVVPEAPDKPAALIIRTLGYARKVIAVRDRPAVGEDGYVSITLEAGAKLIAVADRNTLFGKYAKRVSLGFSQPDGGFDHMMPSAKFDDNNEAVFDSLAPGGYSVTLSGGDGSTEYSGYSLGVTLMAGEETRLVLGRMHGNLTLSGKASSFATVKINGRDIEKGSPSFVVNADVDGDFTLSGLLPGKYAVSMDVSSASSGFRRSAGRSKTVELKNDTFVDLVPNPSF